MSILDPLWDLDPLCRNRLQKTIMSKIKIKCFPLNRISIQFLIFYVMEK